MVADTVTQNINAQLTLVGSITGKVTNGSAAPLDGICVDAYDSGAQIAGDSLTDANGNYTITGLASGNYRVRFHDCGAGTYAGEYYTDKGSLAAADQVVVLAGSTTSSINATLNLTGSISGTVASTSGPALEGICIDADDPNADFFGTGQTDVNGNYTITGLCTR